MNNEQRFSLKDFILDGTKYNPFEPPEEDAFILSASMVGKEPLENYLRIIYGGKESTKIDDMVIGSVFHKGMECMIKEKYGLDPYAEVESEVSMSKKLNNGWYISGTADMIIEDDSIHDFKLAKYYTYKKELEAVKKGQLTNYALQLNTLAWLNSRRETAYRFAGENPNLYIDFFLKDANKVKNEKSFAQLQVPNIQDEMEERLLAITNELEEYLMSGKEPPQCSDLWWRVINKKRLAMRCLYYCSYNVECPYFDENSRQARYNNMELPGW